MRITIDFDTWDEMIAFTTSGKKTRTKKEEAADDAAEQPNPAAATQAPATFTPPAQPMQGFPGSPPAVTQVNPIVAQIIAKDRSRETVSFDI